MLRQVLNIQRIFPCNHREFLPSSKLDKLPDILKEDGYPDVQAFMETYREMEGVVERYEREVWEYNLKLKQKEKPAKKPPEKQSVREHLRQL